MNEVQAYNSNSFLRDTLLLSSRTAASTFWRPLSSVAVTETRCRGIGIPSKLTSRTAKIVGQQGGVMKATWALTKDEELAGILARFADGLRVDAHGAQRAVDGVLRVTL